MVLLVQYMVGSLQLPPPVYSQVMHWSVKIKGALNGMNFVTVFLCE